MICGRLLSFITIASIRFLKWFTSDLLHFNSCILPSIIRHILLHRGIRGMIRGMVWPWFGHSSLNHNEHAVSHAVSDENASRTGVRILPIDSAFRITQWWKIPSQKYRQNRNSVCWWLVLNVFHVLTVKHDWIYSSFDIRDKVYIYLLSKYFSFNITQFVECSVQFFIEMHHTYRYSQNTYTSVQGYNEVGAYKTLLHSTCSIIYTAYDVEIHQMSTVTRDSIAHLTNFITKAIVS